VVVTVSNPPPPRASLIEQVDLEVVDPKVASPPAPSSNLNAPPGCDAGIRENEIPAIDEVVRPLRVCVLSEDGGGGMENANDAGARDGARLPMKSAFGCRAVRPSRPHQFSEILKQSRGSLGQLFVAVFCEQTGAHAERWGDSMPFMTRREMIRTSQPAGPGDSHSVGSSR